MGRTSQRPDLADVLMQALEMAKQSRDTEFLKHLIEMALLELNNVIDMREHDTEMTQSVPTVNCTNDAECPRS